MRRKYFNPRSLAGATKTNAEYTSKVKISIHAPLRERHKTCILSGSWLNFNPRSLAGATCKLSITALSVALFQSTLPCGSDRLTSLMRRRKRYFNPRSLAGATSSTAHFKAKQPDFNPRSLAGATFNPSVKGREQVGISIHAPLRERRDLSGWHLRK